MGFIGLGKIMMSHVVTLWSNDVMWNTSMAEDLTEHHSDGTG